MERESCGEEVARDCLPRWRFPRWLRNQSQESAEIQRFEQRYAPPASANTVVNAAVRRARNMIFLSTESVASLNPRKCRRKFQSSPRLIATSVAAERQSQIWGREGISTHSWATNGGCSLR